MFSVWDLLCLISWVFCLNFYQTFVTVSAEFWLRFEPQIRPAGLAINFLFVTARAERKVRLCVKLFDFFSWVHTYSFDLKSVAFCPKLSRDSYVKFQKKNHFGLIFRKFCANQDYPISKYKNEHT